MAKRYVLFKEHPNTHQEIYYRPPASKDAREFVNSPELAKHFETAADGYRYGGHHGLDTWQVGQR